GQQDTRGIFVGAEDTDRFAGLHQQGLVILESLQRGDDGVEGRPVASRLPGAAIDHQLFGPLGDVGIEVVAEHAQGRFLRPPLGAELGAARRADRGGDPHAASAAIFASFPLRTSSMAVWISGSSTRSWSSVGTRLRIAAWASPVSRPGLSGLSKSIPCAAPRASSARMVSTLMAT